MDNKELKRIYRIEAPGLDQVINKVKQLSEELELQKAIKREASKILLVNKDDASVLEKQSRVIAQAEVAIKKLNAEKRLAVREGEALIKSEERLAAAEITQANATRNAAGSINEAAAQYKALLAVTRAVEKDGLINWQGENIGIDQAKVKLNEYRKTVDDFNRSLSPDGTLVGEYRKGIVSAFADLGLTDIIKDQKLKIQIELSELIDKNKQLVANFNEVGVAGPRGFGRIPPEIDRNIKRAQELEGQLMEINEVLEKQGTIGTQVTRSIGAGFKNIISTGLGVIGITAGLSQVTAALSKSFNVNLKLDSMNNALKLVSKTETELAKNQDFLTQETERLGLELISTTTAFKSFYTASTESGIGANATREIFTAVASSAANLKLSQEDVNGVFTAFGQIASKGKVQAEELRGQIGERIPGAFSIAARAIGVTEQQLNKMMEQGQVVAQDFLPKFAAELQKTFGGDTSQSIDGLQASVNRFQNALSRLFQSERASAFYSAILEGATDVLEFFNDGEKGAADLGKEIEQTANQTDKYKDTLGPLLSRYDELKSKTNLNVDEQAELKSIVDKVTEVVPGAATEIDNYGRALDFNKDKVLSFVDAQDKLAGAIRKTNLDALQKDANQLLKTNAELNKIINQGFIEERSTGTGGVGGGSGTYKLSLINKNGGITPRGQEIKNERDVALEGIVKTADAILKAGGQLSTELSNFLQKSDDFKVKSLERINAINIEISKKTSEAGKAFISGDEKLRSQLAIDIEKLKKERKQLLDPTSVDPVKTNTGTGTGDKGDAEKAARERERRLKEEYDRANQKIEEEYLLKQMDLYKKFYVEQTLNEEQYQQQLFDAQRSAGEKKIQLIKSSSVAEKSEINEINFDILKSEKELNDSIFDLKKKAIERNRQIAIDAATEQAEVILNDPAASGTQKAQAKVDLDNQLITIQQKYNDEIGKLEVDFKQKSEDNERSRAQALKDLRSELNKDLLELTDEGYNEQLDAISTGEVNAIADRALKLRSEVQKILNSNVSSGKKTAQIDRVKETATVDLLDIEIDADKKRLEIFKKQLEEKRISQIDYDRFLESLTNKQISREEKAAKTSVDVEKQKTAAKQMVIGEAQQFAEELVAGFFAQNEDRINREKDVSLQRVENEKQQVLAQAQSAQEKEAIEKEYADKREAIEKQSGERIKKIKKSEAKVALATELANIAVSASNPTANIATFGAYAALYYGLQAGLALTRYGFRVREIDQAQFEYGGMPKKGGKIGGKPHAAGGTPFTFGGESFEAEVNELAIIRTKNAPRGTFNISGTQEQIASALNVIGGGINFRPGAKLRKFEYGGSLGDNLKAPVNPSSFLNNNNDLTALASMVASTQDSINELARQTNNRIDKLQVIQDPRAAMKAQNKVVKNDSIGSL